MDETRRFAELSTDGDWPHVRVTDPLQASLVQVQLSVELDGRQQDVALVAPDAGDAAQVIESLAIAAGAAGGDVWRGERLLPRAGSIADLGLRVGALLTVGKPGKPALGGGLLALVGVAGPAAGMSIALERGNLRIGRDPGQDVHLEDPDVSRHHADIAVGATGITLTDADSTNGTTVDGRRLASEAVTVRPGTRISIGDSRFTVIGPIEIPAVTRTGPDGTLMLHRPPRRHFGPDAGEVAMPSEAVAAREHRIQLLSAVVPAAVGVTFAVVTSSVQFLLFALMSPVMILSGALGDRVHWRRGRRRATADIRRRRARALQSVDEALLRESEQRRTAAPDPATVRRIVELPSDRIWERRLNDADSLQVRIGVADLSSITTVNEAGMRTSAGVVRDVPVVHDLRDGPVGVCAPAEIITGIGRWLVGQLCALHPPADAELFIFLSADRGNDWRWARWLPHLRGRVAVGAAEWEAAIADLTAQVELRRNTQSPGQGRWSDGWLVVVVDRAGDLMGLTGLSDLVSSSAAGVSAIFLDIEPTRLATCCVATAISIGETGNRLQLRTHGTVRVPEVVADQVPPTWAEDLARHLAPLVDAGHATPDELRASCRLPEILGLASGSTADASWRNQVRRRWTSSGNSAPRTAVGQSCDGPLVIDLADDGPHFLVAGTTGSGKSEFLQTLVAGLAANHPPTEINFLLIDYKGGAAFSACADLPHTAGLVTDLDPHLTDRALRSLNSEIRRRETLLAAAGAKDLGDYHRIHASPAQISRLVIVVDEFATLAHELPEFVPGLVAVAQRGRSLGLHLVLATQRPGHVVSQDIRANTGSRIALRVTDPAESRAVIDHAAAAWIRRDTPGRAYIRAGSALRSFQTAHGGTAHDPDRSTIMVETLQPWRRPRATEDETPSPSDLAALVDAVRAAADEEGHLPAKAPWLAPLPHTIHRSCLPAESRGAVALGLADFPDSQLQATVDFDLESATSLLITGTASSGRTHALMTVGVGAAEQYPASQLHLYVVDAGGVLSEALGPLPHCATALGPAELELVLRLFDRIRGVCHGAVVDASTRARGTTTRSLLLVDRWDSVCAMLGDHRAAELTTSLMTLLRDGPSVGVSVVVSGERSTLSPRFAGSFHERIVLRLSDRNDYAVAGIGGRIPDQMPPGRGFRASDGAQLQLAHFAVTPQLTDASSHVQDLSRRLLADGSSRDLSRGIRIRPLPARVRLDEMPPPPDGLLNLGVGGDDASPLAIDPFAGRARLLITGPPRSGKTTALRALGHQARESGTRVVVAAPHTSPLADDARTWGVPLIPPHSTGRAQAAIEPTLLLIDDGEAFVDAECLDSLMTWMSSPEALSVIVSARIEDLAVSYRGPASLVKRHRCGILLQPRRIDGEVFGIVLPAQSASAPPGRGIALGDPLWGSAFSPGGLVPIQLASM